MNMGIRAKARYGGLYIYQFLRYSALLVLSLTILNNTTNNGWKYGQNSMHKTISISIMNTNEYLKRKLAMCYRPIFLIFILVLAFSCDRNEGCIRYVLVNNSSLQIEYLLPIKYNYGVPFEWGTMEDIAPDDTTMKSAGQVFSYKYFRPYSRWSYNTGYKSIKDMSPYDTVRVFVYDGAYYDCRPVPDRHIFYDNEDFYCRYDLTLNNLSDLLDSNGNIVICFPPSEAMMAMKMFPPYQKVLDKYSVVGQQSP